MKKEYRQPQLEYMEVTAGQFLCDSPGGASHGGGNNGGGNAPARTLYV